MAKARYKGGSGGQMAAEKMANRWKTGKIPRTFKAQLGDSWYRLAGKIYNDQKLAPTLMAANNGGVGTIQPGQKIRVPKPYTRMNKRRVRYNQAPTTRE